MKIEARIKKKKKEEEREKEKRIPCEGGKKTRGGHTKDRVKRTTHTLGTRPRAQTGGNIVVGENNRSLSFCTPAKVGTRVREPKNGKKRKNEIERAIQRETRAFPPHFGTLTQTAIKKKARSV